MTSTPKQTVVTVGIPTGDYFSVSREFNSSLVKMLVHSYESGLDRIVPVFAASPSTAANRNTIAAKMEGDFMLQIDADMVFEPDTLTRMLATAEANPDCIITGLGFMGSAPFYPAIFRWNPEKANASPYGSWPDHPFEVDLCGSFGFLVPKKVLEAVGPGPFNHIFLQKEDGNRREIRHDFAFCLRAREAGFKIICDPSIKFGHLRPFAIGEADWFAMQELQNTSSPTPDGNATAPLDGTLDEQARP